MGTAAGWIALSGHRRPFPHGPSGGSLVLTKQLAYYRDHQIRRRRLTDAARLSLVLWSRLFEEALMVVTPGTFVRWHRKGFKRYWRWKSGGGRPALPKDIRQLIARMVRENLTWGEERVADELSLKLGISGFTADGSQILAPATGWDLAETDLLAALANIRQEALDRSVQCTRPERERSVVAASTDCNARRRPGWKRRIVAERKTRRVT